MAKFICAMNRREAVIAVKRTVNGKVAILKDKDDLLVVGAPMMTVKIKFENGTVETKASPFGKAILGTVNSCIELADGFTKQ